MKHALYPYLVATLVLGVVSITFGGCTSSSSSSEDDPDDGINLPGGQVMPSADGGMTTATEDTTPTAEPDAEPTPERGQLVHSFGVYTIGGGRERSPCVSWTLNNDAPLYVEKVTLSNNGAYHHSNWFVVPEDVYPGEDGYWRCSSRDFDEVAAALEGTVLFAQSTQSRYEEQFLGEGVVIKIPPRHKVVADVHLLNLSPQDVDTDLRMSLELIHPTDIDTIVTPFRMVYTDLNIPPQQRSRFSGVCNLSTAFASQTGSTMVDMEVFWVLPHYHNLGDHFSLEVFGGPMDGQKLFELDGFNAEANGQAYNPPVPLAGATGLKFTCGYNNPRDRRVYWGIGDQEMCVMLGFARSPVILDALVLSGNRQVGTTSDDVSLHEGNCLTLAYAPNRNQGPPAAGEYDAPLYVPESDPTDIDLDPVPACEDADPTVSAAVEPTLTNLHATVFAPSCSFTSCHDATVPAAGLDLTREGLHQRLMTVASKAQPDMPMVSPGDPDGSVLYQRTAHCQPSDGQGIALTAMPLNSPTLLDPDLVAVLRDWIAGGALNN
ncbi:MAG: hypothetical protein AAFX99_06190 [Myxococcota bacterium]